MLGLRKGDWKLEEEPASASEDCSRRWEGAVEAVTASREMVEDGDGEEVGRVCRVQVRRAGPADAGAGRILRVIELGEIVVEEMGA